MAENLDADSAAAFERAVLPMAIEGWRFARTSSRVLQKLEAAEQSRYGGQIRYFLRYLEETLSRASLRFVDLQGQIYDAGLPVAALNAGDFEPGEHLKVDQMLEPVVMGPEGVVRPGTVMLKKAD